MRIRALILIYRSIESLDTYRQTSQPTSILSEREHWKLKRFQNVLLLNSCEKLPAFSSIRVDLRLFIKPPQQDHLRLRAFALARFCSPLYLGSLPLLVSS